MKAAYAFCLLVLFVSSAVCEDDGKVVDLTAETFDGHISSHDLTLVEFFAPWCHHCKALAPEYDEAARQLKGKHKIAKVDCTEQKDLCTTHGIKGFPTLKLFRKDGTSSDYDDARKADNIVKFVVKQSSPAFVVVSSEEALKTFKESGGSNFDVVLYTSDENSAASTEFKLVANALHNDVDFAISTGHKGKDYVKIFRDFDVKELTFEDTIKSDDVTAWIKRESLPLVGEIGPENYHKYVERDLPLLWSFVDYSNTEQTAMIESLGPVAAEFRSKVLICKLDGQRWGDHAKSFGLSGKLPGLAIEDRKTRKNYVLPEGEQVTAAAVKQHIENYLAGKMTATMRSQEAPADNSGPVKTVVGKTWDSIVLDGTKDVFIEFYAPWCGHCKSLKPKYQKLGEQFTSEPNVVIAQIDGTENDTPVEVQGFPTMFFYPSNDKANPLPYNGDRSTEAMAKFIRDHSTVLKKGGGKDEL